MRYLVILALVGLILAPRAAEPVTAAGDCSATPLSLNDPLTAGVWQSIMAKRAASGLPAFTWSDTLARSAAWMARDEAGRGSYQPGTDSLGRSARVRDTDCGYRSDATVGESSYWFYNLSDGGSIFNLWFGNGPGMYSIVYSYSGFPPAYTVGGLGHARAANGMDYWVLDVGTLNDIGGAVTPTPIPPTATPIPFVPTATSTPVNTPTATPVPTAAPDQYPVDYRCISDTDGVDIVAGQEFGLSCR